MIPFLVADRPISLSIIKGISLPPGAKIGILSQAATTTDRFKQLFRAYPYKTDVLYSNGQPSDRTIQNRTVKVVDSGIFGKNGCHLEYHELYDQYELMGADYGIMIDVMRDAEATLESAKQALAEYEKKEHSFKLVAVAQGETADDYFRCFEQLQNAGFNHIAVGGLLQKRENTVRYAYVRCSKLMEQALLGIRKRFDPRWLFALGVFHPSRIELFRETGVWGSDYKGWIFNYEKKDKVIELLRTGKIVNARRVAVKDLKVNQVQQLSEQELRFLLARSCVERRVMDQLHGRRLLVISCSARKHAIRDFEQAWDLYDGVAYRTMKKIQREGHFPRDLDILILSAEHGIIVPSHQIAPYDRKMDRVRSAELKSQVTAYLKETLHSGRYREVLLWMGKEYLDAVKPLYKWREGKIPVRIARGRLGEKLHKLKTWLEN